MNQTEYRRFSEAIESFGWKSYPSKKTIDICKKVPELKDAAWLSIDLSDLENGVPLDKAMLKSVEEFRAVCGACRVALSRDTSIKDLSETDAVIKLYDYINKMIEIKQEMIDISREIKRMNVKLLDSDSVGEKKNEKK